MKRGGVVTYEYLKESWRSAQVSPVTAVAHIGEHLRAEAIEEATPGVHVAHAARESN